VIRIIGIYILVFASITSKEVLFSSFLSGFLRLRGFALRLRTFIFAIGLLILAFLRL
jgi:hypothetical protein